MDTYRRGEFHTFQGGGTDYLYLVPSAAIFALDARAKAVINLLEKRECSREEIIKELSSAGHPAREVEDTIDELHMANALEFGERIELPPFQMPQNPFPLQTVVLNVTNQCNLSCSYCYEYGEDRIASPDTITKFMDEQTAFNTVDFLLDQSPGRRVINLTFFGGETLLNFKVVKSTIEYARKRAAESGKYVDFSLTTNATMLTQEIINFLAENNVGVTISIDGPKEANDRFRVFSNGMGSYDVIAPRIKDLLKTHRSRPIGARVTLTAQVVDVKKIFQHLTEEMGFDEVGFAPVTTSTVRVYSIGNKGMDSILEQFTELANEYRDYALQDKNHAFSNVSDTLQELHQGISKAYPCGAGLGLVGVSPSGDVGLCHRFVDSPVGALGHIDTGIDRAKQTEHLTRGHISTKSECLTCWARPVCSGGCYHEAYVRTGDLSKPNLHYCEWIRGWTDVCLRIYGEIAARHPKYLERFNDRKAM